MKKGNKIFLIAMLGLFVFANSYAQDCSAGKYSKNFKSPFQIESEIVDNAITVKLNGDDSNVTYVLLQVGKMSDTELAEKVGDGSGVVTFMSLVPEEYKIKLVQMKDGELCNVFYINDLEIAE